MKPIPKTLLFTFLCLFILPQLPAQSVELILTHQQLGRKSCHGVIPIIKADGKKLYFHEKTYKIEFLDSLRLSDLAFGLLPFRHNHPKGIHGNAVFMIENFDKDKVKVWVDGNFNLDFRDDGEPLGWGQDSISIPERKIPSMEVSLQHLQNLNRKARFDLFPASLTNIEGWSNIGNVFSRKNRSNPIVSPLYWLGFFSQNVKTAQFVQGKDTFYIGLSDSNLDGYYKTSFDKIITIEPGKVDFLDYPQKFKWSIRFNEPSYFMLGKQCYQTDHLGLFGDTIRFHPIETPADFSKIMSGNTFPIMELVKINDPNPRNIREFFERGKYIVLDFWGTWCRPCVESIPKLKLLSEKYPDKLQVIGIAKDEREKVISFNKKNDIRWHQFIADDFILDSLNIQGFPTYVILDQNWTVIDITYDINYIESILPFDP